MRSWLLLLVLCSLLPTLGVGGAAAWLAVSSSRSAAEARLLDTARALALAVDRQIEMHIAALVTLAATPVLDSDSPNLAAVRPQADTVARQLDAVVVIRGPGPDYPILLNTRTPPNQNPPPSRPLDPVRSSVPRVFSTGQPAISDLVPSGPVGQLATAVFVPVRRDGEVRLVVGTVLTPERLSSLLRDQRHGSGLIATVTDSRGVITGRSAELEAMLGRTRPPRTLDQNESNGILHGRGIVSGLPTRVAYSNLQTAPGWTLWVVQSQASLDATWQRPALLLALGATLALVMAATVAFGVARRIGGPLAQLARRAEASTANAGAGPPLAAIPPTAVRELERLRVALDGADQALRRRLVAEQQAAAALRDSEARFRAMADNIPQLAWMATPDGWIFWFNRRWYDFTGTTLEQMRGWGWRRVHHPDHLHRVTTHFRQQVLAGEPWEDTFPLRSKTGEWHWFLSRALPIRDHTGKVMLWFGTNTDITEQRAAEAALATSEERLRLAIDSTGLATLDADLDTGVAIATPNLFTARGMPVPPDGQTSLAALRDTLHPEDRERVMRDAERAEREGGMCHTVHRILRADDGAVRWMEVIAQVRQEADGRRRWVSVQIDVTDRLAAEEQRLMLMREVDHRAKNVLAVVQALLALTPTESEAARRFAEAVGSRVAAMARAHALLARERWVGAILRTLVEEELAPYVAGRPEAASLEGPLLRLPAGLAQPLSLVLHELATNAAKYGALSLPAGRLAVRWSIGADGGLELSWQESGGPPLAGAPDRLGFGSRLVGRTLKHQLRGEARFDWQPEGLHCLLTIPLPDQPSDTWPR